MKVRVKDGMLGFIYGSLRHGADIDAGRMAGDEFTLKTVKHSVQKNEKGEPLVISIDQQFSDKWMEKVSSKKSKS